MSKRKKKHDVLRQPPPDDAQLDFFAPLILDLAFKDQREVMERPFVSLSVTRPQKTPIEYKSPDGNVWVKVVPHPDYGMATINDWDIIIWAAGHIWERISNGEPPYRTIRFYPYSLLKSVRREARGKYHYQKLKGALQRLHTTTIETSIGIGERNHLIEDGGFHLIDNWKMVRDSETNEVLCWQITLNKWIYEKILDKRNILTIDPNYFLLQSGIDRWLYRIARKHAGTQPAGFTISLEELHNKSGTSRSFRKWAFDVRDKVKDRVLLGYCFDLYGAEDGRKMVHIIHSSQLAKLVQESTLDMESRLAPSRQKQASRLRAEQQPAFWGAEMNKAAHRAKRKETLSTLHHSAREAFGLVDNPGG